MIPKVYLTLLVLAIGNSLFAQFGQENAIVYRGSLGTNGVHAADLDGDGDADPISISVNDNRIAWYENHGNGQFGLSKVISTQAHNVSAVFTADLDNDGDSDLLFASIDDNTIGWFENDGAGNFGLQQVICDTVAGASDVYSADLDNDGDYDVLSTSKNDNKIAWYANLGNGNFGPQQLINGAANGAKALMAKDFNADGLIDVVAVSENDNVVGWYRNLGGGSFSAIISISTLVDGLVDVYAADIDSDGLIDIVSASVNDHKIAWYRNLGSNTFSTQNVVTLQIYNPVSLSVALVDENATKDILVAGIPFNNSDGVYLMYCRNLGSSFPLAPIPLMANESRYVNDIFSSDLDNDGDSDFLFASDQSEFDLIGWLNNDAAVDFPLSRSISDPLQRPADLCVADLNGDGRPDVVSVSELGGQIAWYPNLGGNQFGLQQVIAYDLYWWGNALQTADLDQDGDQDVLGGTPYRFGWFENNGTGIFDTMQMISPDQLLEPGISAVTDIQTLDMDGDSDLDIITSSEADDRICLFENLGAGSFGTMNILTETAGQVNAITIADVNGDGLKDLIAGIFYEVVWYKNLGGNAFGPKQTVGSFEGVFNDVAVLDMDGDGDTDVLAGGYIRAVWYENTGVNTYWPEHVINNDFYNYYTVATMDVDEDGDQDVFTTGDSGIQTPGPGPHFAFWHENLGNGVFGPAFMLDSNTYGVFLADLDGDTDQEVLMYGNHRIGWKENYTIHTTTASGRLFADMNQNLVFDLGEAPLQHTGILSVPENAFSHTFVDGTYSLSFDETIANYEVFPQDVPHWDIITDSLSYHLTVDSFPGVTESLDFGFYPAEFANELQATLTGGFPRCNTVVNYWLTVRNIGTTLLSGTIHLQLDDSITYIGSDLAPVTINGQDLYWEFNDLNYFAEQQINIQVQMPDFNSMGDDLQSLLTITADSSGVALYTSIDTLHQTLVCAYDPNDKAAIPTGEGPIGEIPMSSEWLDYTIRFQNTGNDTAVNVVIRDLIDTDLDRTSFNLIASSAPVVITGTANGEMTFAFNAILLPDSSTNELESHGFIRYRIKLREGLPVGTEIENTADIYFDQNPAIVTNTTLHTLTSGLSSTEISENDLHIFPNPFKGSFTVVFDEKVSGNRDLVIRSMTGAEVYSQRNLTGQNVNVTLPNATKGVYFIEVYNQLTGGKTVRKMVAM